MYIIPQSPSASGAFPPLQHWGGLTPPAGFDVWPDELEQDTFQQYNGFVVLTVVRGVVSSYQPNTEAWEAFQQRALPGLKADRIAQSKQALTDYLLTHPMQWTDGAYYAITAEKQQQLTSKILSATMAAQTKTAYTLTWNSTGEVCKPWTLQDLSALAFAIDARVTSLVSYQQEKEVEIRNAASMEALEAITVDYDSVPLPAAPTNGGEQA